ncbi:MAG: choice-of-anchor D domain-containing protein [Roseibacillus sp.]|nr:choice-of-anchor D domain-containing protein [Roseibacillus sp.]
MSLRSFALFTFCAVAFQLASVRADLLAHWPLDNDAADATGNGHDGVVVGGTVNFGQPGANAATGDAAAFPDNGHIDVLFDAALNPGTQGVDGAGSFTIALWANSSNNGGFNSPFTAREDNGANVNGPIIYNNNAGNWSYWAGNNGPSGQWNAINGPAVPLNTWQHVAVTYDSATLTRKMFIDGSEVLTANLGVSANAQRDIHIGSGQDNGLNFYWNGLIDDVGLWDVALNQVEIASVMNNGIGGGVADPNLSTRGSYNLTFDGVDGSFSIPIDNIGETQDLNITGIPVIGGPDAANFSVVTVPGPIGPDAAATLECSFDPLGAAGMFEATFDIASDDPLEPNKTVTVRMTFRDPFVSGPAAIDFETLTSGAGAQVVQISIENPGISQLDISGITLSGPDAGNFSLGAFTSIAGGGMIDVDLTFNSNGQEGSFVADLTIESNDPIVPSLIVPIVARVEFSNPLIAHWPLDTDASDATGNGFDGAVVGGTVDFGQPGANAATGTAASFPDNGHIDVLYDAALNPGEKAPAGAESFTIALWANSTSNSGFNSPFTSREDSDSVNGPIIYNNPSGNWSYWAGNNGPSGQWNAINDGPVPLNTWVHVAVTYEALETRRKMFVDGVEVINQILGVSANSERDIHIGAGQDDGNNFFWNGLIDDVGLFRVALTEEQVLAVMNNGVASFNKSSRFPFRVSNAPNDTLAFRWDSQAGKLYNLLSVTNPSAPIPPGAEPAAPSEWPVFGNHTAIAASPPENILTIPRPADPARYFVIEEYDAPPVVAFSDDLESGVGAWTTVVNDAIGNTDWQLGTPVGSTGPITGVGGSTNAWCTNLGDYGADSDISLRSPAIDLSALASATLVFKAYRDADGFGDFATIRFLRASDQVQLGAETQIDMAPIDIDWITLNIPVVPEAIGETILIEWTFTSDSSQDAFSGLSLDDIEVTD